MKSADGIFDKLYSAASKAMKNASAPYSDFKVGAAVLTSRGKIYSGCNVESSSYGLTVCAERNAVFSAVCAGERDFTHILIIADTDGPVSPCGACRQIIYDYAPGAIVIMTNTKKDRKEEKIESLLKYPFGFKKS